MREDADESSHQAELELRSSGYDRAGGLWTEFRQARKRDSLETDRLKALIHRLSGERLAMWKIQAGTTLARDSARARALTGLLNGYDDDCLWPSRSASVHASAGFTERTVDSSSEQATKRAGARVKRWRSTASHKDREAARKPLWDQWGIVCPGLVGLGMVTTWIGDPNTPSYPSAGGRWRGPSQSVTVTVRKVPKQRVSTRVTNDTKDRGMIRDLLIHRLSTNYNTSPSIREVARLLGTTNRKRVRRLYMEAVAQLRAKTETVNGKLDTMNLKLDRIAMALTARETRPDLKVLPGGLLLAPYNAPSYRGS